MKTLDDFKLEGKTVLVRCDFNTPIDPATGGFLEDRRLRSHKDTLLELSQKKAKVVIMAHQGRSGEAEFTTTENHAKHLGEILGVKVDYIEDIFGKYARDKIKAMKDGEISLLENVRFYSEEETERPSDVQATTFVVKKLSPLIDIFINDCFGAAHRSQPTVVGFTRTLPSGAGRLMEKEISSLSKVHTSTKKPVVFVLGGAKVNDSIKIVEKALSSNVDMILTGGLLANVLLAAKGYRIGEPSIEIIRGKKFIEQIPMAKELLDKYEDRIVLPADVALNKNGERVEISVSNLPMDYKIEDVGSSTIQKYVDILKKAGTIFANGALGVYETPKFAIATEKIINTMAECKNAFTVIGGGDTVAAARNLNVEDKITHISTGGKASIMFLAGSKLAAIDALKNSVEGKVV
ncbi:MAG: phosphoglycerate kinase [Candidatus Altiarchaeales archaeon]|nr:phosphoglycerate kinase [Candidatus Altiarchaeales archaeon]